MLRRRVWLLVWALIAAVPVLHIATHVVAASRNIVFWDEFDTALDLILRIHDGADAREILGRFFAINNEHRTVTSRLIFAGSYWLTGTINFHVIGAIGNAFIVGACGFLVLAVDGWERRVRMGVLLAFLIFQLEHFENFIWSGASIDHFQVVMLAVGAIAALARASENTTAASTWRWLAAAAACGVLATFTLAHGNLVWPIGGVLLLTQRRWNLLTAWAACAAIAIAAFFHGFQFNPGHHITERTFSSVVQIARYWLALVGAPLTLGDVKFAPVPGTALVAGLVILAARGALRREPVAMFTALFAIGSLAGVAVGRSEIAATLINSRYMVLGALAWAMFVFMLLEQVSPPEKPFRRLGWMLPALAAFNISAAQKFAPMIDSFVEVRDRAATSFMQHGADGRGITRLHPIDKHADVLLKMAEERGVYRLPSVSHRVECLAAKNEPTIMGYIDEILVSDRAVTIGGWAMRPGKRSRRGQAHVVLRTADKQWCFTTVTLQRPDVAKAYNEPRWHFSGFRAVIERDRLPAEDFEVGVLVVDGNRAEYLMTKNRLLLSSPKEAKALHVTENP